LISLVPLLSRHRSWNFTEKVTEYAVESWLELSVFRTTYLYVGQMMNFLLGDGSQVGVHGQTEELNGALNEARALPRFHNAVAGGFDPASTSTPKTLSSARMCRAG
jgi:hypothetical protein